MQIQPSDPQLHLCDMKVEKLEAMDAPPRSLPRSASARADAPPPFSSNPANQPASTPTTPAASAAAAAASSFGCMAATPTDTPPATPKARAPTSAAAYYASLWSPRRLMQRAARAFRSSRSRRRMKVDARDEPAAAVSVATSGRASDAASGGSMDAEHGSSDAQDGAAADKEALQVDEQQQQHPEAVPEKIIHEANHHQAPTVFTEAAACEKTADEKENGAAAEEEKEEEEAEEPKKGAAPEADVADKFCMVVKAAIKKHEEEAGVDAKKEAVRMFQGSRVKTAMEAREESEQPRRREAARSNDVIEEARSKLQEMRQLSRVRALVGAFETVMDAKPNAAAGKPQHHYRKSA